jgi:hypothetical protein
MAMLWGKPVLAGAQLRGAQISDLAPTILHLMGEAVPADMDGRVLAEALRPEYAEVRSAEGAPSVDGEPRLPAAADTTLSDEEASLVAERLRGLGYVG